MVVLNEHTARGDDPTGHGDYGKSRGNRKHKGFDMVGKPGDVIYTPITGVISKIGYCYSFELFFRYIEIKNDEYRVRLMYGLPTNDIFVGKKVVEEDVVGNLQDIAGYWNRNKQKGQSMMLNHLHVQIWKNSLLTDPEPLMITNEL